MEALAWQGPNQKQQNNMFAALTERQKSVGAC